MAQYSYTRTAASTANIGQALDLYESLLTAHPAWTRVDLVTSGSTTVSVWRCSATLNAFAKAFHVLLYRIGTTDLFAVVAEDYDVATKTVGRVIPTKTEADVTPPGADGSYLPDTPLAILNGAAVPAAFHRLTLMAATGAVANDLWCVVTNNFFAVFAARLSTTIFVYAGLFESFVIGEPMPLILGNTVATAGLGTGQVLSRFPFVTAPQTNNWQVSTNWSNATNAAWTSRAGVLSGLGDRLHNQRPVAARVPVWHAGASDTHGQLRGLYRDVLGFNQISGSAALGDTIVINNDVYAVCYAPSTFAYVINTSAP